MNDRLPSLFSPSPSPSPPHPASAGVSTPPPAADADLAGLQFDRAEISAAGAPAEASTCAGCGAPLSGSYFEVNGQPACERCRDEVERRWKTGPGAAGFVRALGAGLAGAAAGSLVYFLVLRITGYEVGLIGILVGYLAGRGVHWGARGRGGWLYQGLAILLTYLAIVATYVPMIVKSEPLQKAGSSKYVLAAIVALAIPIFEVKRGQLLGLVIIGISLYEAWKLNRRQRLVVGGPYPVAARDAAAAASAEAAEIGPAAATGTGPASAAGSAWTTPDRSAPAALGAETAAFDQPPAPIRPA